MKSKFIFCVICLFILTGCRQSETLDKTIRIGHFPSTTHAQALLLRENNLLKDLLGDEYTLTFKSFKAGSAEIEAFLSEEIDIGYIGPIPAINGFVKSKGELLILSGASNSGIGLIVQKDSNIYSLKNLQNKKIAIPQLGNTQHIKLLEILDKEGLRDTHRGGNVDIYPISNDLILQTFENGDIDGAYLPEPWGSQLVEDGQAKWLIEPSSEEIQSAAVILVRKDYLATHPKEVELFLKAHQEVTIMLNDNRTKYLETIKEQIQSLSGKTLSKDTIKKSLEHVVFDTSLSSQTIQYYIDLFYEQGFIDTPINADDIISSPSSIKEKN